MHPRTVLRAGLVVAAVAVILAALFAMLGFAQEEPQHHLKIRPPYPASVQIPAEVHVVVPWEDHFYLATDAGLYRTDDSLALEKWNQTTESVEHLFVWGDRLYALVGDDAWGGAKPHLVDVTSRGRWTKVESAGAEDGE